MMHLALLAAWLPGSALAEPQTLQLARAGKSLVPIVVGPDASPRVVRAANDLATYLGRIADTRFEVVVGDGATGIAVGLPASFPALRAADFRMPAAVEPESYSIRTSRGGAGVIGASDTGVEHGVWDFLYRLGYRQFFPGQYWEIVPHVPDLAARIEVQQVPSYRARRIWYTYGPWDYAAEPYRQWTVRNRTAGGTDLQTGHAYAGIIQALKPHFDRHPEFYPLIDGQRRPSREAKLCIGNEDLRRLVVELQLERFRKNPALAGISMDPSDGGGWCECDKCRALGSISDRVAVLANEVAVAINQQNPGRLVGMYAYNFHSAPPSVVVAPGVVVSVATAFLKGGMTVDETMDGWAKQGAVLGVREYYSVNAWDRDQPAQARGGDIAYLTRTIPAFHAKGVRFMSAEASDNWGPNGLGYYIASRLLWDTSEAGRVDALVDDFLERAFGPAREPMRAFYEQLDGSKPHLMADDQIGRMFRALAQARPLAAADAGVAARLDDLVQYAHYSSLYHRYAKAEGVDRQAAFEALIRHAYRMRTTMLVHSKALYRDLVLRDKTISLPAEAAWNVPEDRNPWKSSAPFGRGELDAMVREGIERHPLAAMAFAPVTFSDRLVPAPQLKREGAEPGAFGPGRGVQTYLVHVEQAPTVMELKVTGGLEPLRRSRENVRVSVWKVGGTSETGDRETPVAEDRSTPADGIGHVVKLPIAQPGLYKVAVSDGMDRTLVEFAGSLPVVVPSTAEAPMNAGHEQWTAYFYVPPGTTTIGLFGGEHGEVQDSRDRTVFWLNGRQPGFHAIEVPKGEDGKAWRVRYGRGAVRLLTVPSYFSEEVGKLLVPGEVFSHAHLPDVPPSAAR